MIKHSDASFELDTLQSPQIAAAPAKVGNSLQVRAVPLPTALATQMFSAFQSRTMDTDSLASALLQIGAQATGPSGAVGADAYAISEMLTGQGRMHEAETVLRQALAASRALSGSEQPDVLRLQNALAGLLQAQGRLHDARRLYLATVDSQRRTLGSHHLDTLETLENLAALLVEQDDLKYAEPLLCEAVALRRSSQGETHPSTLKVLGRLAVLLVKQGKLAQAEELMRRNLNNQRALLGEAHTDTLTTMGELANLLTATGNIADAEALFVRVCMLSEAALGASHHQTLVAAYNFAGFLALQRRHADARPYLIRALEVSQRLGDTDAFFAAGLKIRLGECLAALTFYEAAERQLTAGYDVLRDALGLMHPRTQRVLSDLIALYEAWGKPRQAAPYRAAHAACS